MKAFVFSIGEKTTDLCCELMELYGFEVILYNDGTTLWDKLKRFYTEALESDEQQFLRIDADIIPNSNVKKLAEMATGWTCAVGYDWYKQDRSSISIHIMDKQTIRECLEHIEEAKNRIRPETYLWRLPMVNPRTKHLDWFSCGLHGYGQVEHRGRIKQLKHLREQNYDWDLIEKIENL